MAYVWDFENASDASALIIGVALCALAKVSL